MEKGFLDKHTKSKKKKEINKKAARLATIRAELLLLKATNTTNYALVKKKEEEELRLHLFLIGQCITELNEELFISHQTVYKKFLAMAMGMKRS